MQSLKFGPYQLNTLIKKLCACLFRMFQLIHNLITTIFDFFGQKTPEVYSTIILSLKIQNITKFITVRFYLHVMYFNHF